MSPLEIKDKRRFNTDGTMKEGPPIEQEPVSETAPAGEKPPRAPAEAFEINFPTFVLSLASSAQISLGLVPHPITNKPEVNLVSAKQTIDIISLLEEKTKGNLSKEEETLVKQILYELRMQYVDTVNKKGSKK